MKQKYYQKLIIFTFCFFITSLTVIKAQENSIFDIARDGTLEQLKSAVKENPNIINKVSDKGYAPLTLACYYGNNEVAKYLIKHVKDLNSKSGYGTPLMAATVKNNKELVKLLLENKANPNAVDQNGSTALHFSAIFSYEEIIKLLVVAKADGSLKDNRGKTALDYAKITGNQKITQLLKQ
ncbi:MAG: ankyrin repeat domain-containing protein [Flavobacteriaceae bacterium]